jgi:molybdopterin-guanine dinucleotide biosynthesis protein A
VVKNVEILGVVIAGGASRRMLQSKATLSHPTAASFLHFSLGLFQQAGMEVVISGPKNSIKAGSIDCLEDKIGQEGPIGGLNAVMCAYPNRPLLVIPVDMPALTPHILSFISSKPLKDKGLGRVLAHAPQSTAKEAWSFYPFPLLLSPLAFSSIQSAVERENWPLMPFLQSLNLEIWPLTDIETPQMINVNTPDELQLFYDTPGR